MKLMVCVGLMFAFIAGGKAMAADTPKHVPPVGMTRSHFDPNNLNDPLNPKNPKRIACGAEIDKRTKRFRGGNWPREWGQTVGRMPGAAYARCIEGKYDEAYKVLKEMDVKMDEHVANVKAGKVKTGLTSHLGPDGKPVEPAKK